MTLLVKPIDLIEFKITQKNSQENSTLLELPYRAEFFRILLEVFFTSRRSISLVSKVIQGQGQILGRPTN